MQEAFGGPEQIGNTLAAATPILFTGLATAVAFRVGVFKVGVEGSLYVGAFVAAWFGFSFVSLPGPVLIVGAVVLGGLAGLGWAIVPGVELGRAGAIFHTHAKDTAIQVRNAGLNGVLDTVPMAQVGERSWIFRTVGYGHGELDWRRILMALRLAGYDGVLSIEHEDALLSIDEAFRKGGRLPAVGDADRAATRQRVVDMSTPQRLRAAIVAPGSSARSTSTPSAAAGMGSRRARRPRPGPQARHCPVPRPGASGVRHRRRAQQLSASMSRRARDDGLDRRPDGGRRPSPAGA